PRLHSFPTRRSSDLLDDRASNPIGRRDAASQKARPEADGVDLPGDNRIQAEADGARSQRHHGDREESKRHENGHRFPPISNKRRSEEHTSELPVTVK